MLVRYQTILYCALTVKIRTLHSTWLYSYSKKLEHFCSNSVAKDTCDDRWQGCECQVHAYKKFAHTYIYIHTYLHSRHVYIHTCTYIWAYIHTYIHTVYIHTVYIHTYIHAYLLTVFPVKKKPFRINASLEFMPWKNQATMLINVRP